MKNLQTLDTHTRFCECDYGPWQETFTLQRDQTGLVLVVAAGYSKPFDSRTYRLYGEPDTALSECLRNIDEWDGPFVDTERDQSDDLAYELKVGVEELEPADGL